MNMFNDLFSIFSLEKEVSDYKIWGYFLLLLSWDSEVDVVNVHILSKIGPVLFRLFLHNYKKYSSFGVMEVAEHDNGLDIFFINHFPELGDALGSWSLCKDSEVFSVYNWLHEASVAVVVGWTIACNSTVVV